MASLTEEEGQPTRLAAPGVTSAGVSKESDIHAFGVLVWEVSVNSFEHAGSH